MSPPAEDDDLLDYKALFAKSPWPIFVVDKASLRIVAVNTAAVERYGYTREELLSMRATELRPPEDVESFVASFRSWGRSGPDVVSRVPQTCRHRKKDGSVFDAEIWRMNVTYGGTAAQMAFVQDVTARVRMEEQLRQAQKMEAVGLLAGGIAHDFNNFLSIILGSAELAGRSLGSGAAGDVAERIHAIIDAAKRAADVTRRILAFSRAQTLRVETLDLNEEIPEFTRLLARVVGEDVSVDVRPGPERLVVRVDRAQLEQVLLNLCTNARQAMPSGGRLAIETCATSFDDDFVSRHAWARAGEYAELRVIDSGIGMDPQTQARVFEPFFTTREQGTGLGLAVVYGIVQQHGGSVALESRPGVGTTVRVLWPRLSESASVRPGASVAAPQPSGGAETILVAEDEPALRTLIARWLKGLGYKVLVAEDGEMAVRTFSEMHGEVALAVLDVVMPKLSGPDAFFCMKAVDASARAIFTSGHSPDRSHLAAVEQAGYALLSKPFDLDDLARAVRGALDG